MDKLIFENSNFYKNIQDFFVKNDKNTYLEILAELYNRTEKIYTKSEIETEMLNELKKMFLKFQEDGIDSNIVKDKVTEMLVKLEPNLAYKNDLKKPLYVHDYFGGNIWIDNNTTETEIQNCVNRANKVGFNSYLIPFYHKYDSNTQTITQLPTDEIIKKAIDIVKTKNPKFLALKIHISPNSCTSFPSGFMENYFVPIVHHVANICEEKGVTNLFISNEQSSLTSNNRTIWNGIVNYCHNLGIKCYSSFAGYSDFRQNVMCDLLDGIGLNYYPPSVQTKENISEGSVRVNFDKANNKQYQYVFDLIKEYVKKDIDIFVSEIGCCNNIDSLNLPHSSTFSNDIQKEDYQAYYYNAFLSELGTNKDLPIKGIFVWSLSHTPNRYNSNIFSPLYNELCEKTIKKYMEAK